MMADSEGTDKHRCVVVMYDTLCRHFLPSYGEQVTPALRPSSWSISVRHTAARRGWFMSLSHCGCGVGGPTRHCVSANVLLLQHSLIHMARYVTRRSEAPRGPPATHRESNDDPPPPAPPAGNEWIIAPNFDRLA